MGIMTANAHSWIGAMWQRSLALVIDAQSEIAQTDTSTDGHNAGSWTLSAPLLQRLRVSPQDLPLSRDIALKLRRSTTRLPFFPPSEKLP